MRQGNIDYKAPPSWRTHSLGGVYSGQSSLVPKYQSKTTCTLSINYYSGALFVPWKIFYSLFHTMELFINSRISEKESSGGQQRVNSLIAPACCGNLSAKSSRFPISKSSKSKPGATVQPTRLKAESFAGREANQHPPGTTVKSFSFSARPRRSTSNAPSGEITKTSKASPS